MCLISWIYVRGSCGLMDSPPCSFISNVRWSGRLCIPRGRWWFHRIVKIMAPVSILSQLGIPPGCCSMIEPNSTINPGSDVVVLPPFSCVGSVVQVSAVADVQTMPVQPEVTPHVPRIPHLEDFVTGSHPSLGAEGCAALTDLFHKYNHVFPSPGIW